MSTSGQGSPSGERPEGFSKFIRRASKILKGTSYRDSVASTSDIAPTTITSRPPARTSPAMPPKQQTKRGNTQPTELAVTSTPITSAAALNKLQEEKARALFAKWGMTLEPSEWTPVWKGDAGRVEKTVCMRIHRQCHRCETTFGTEKVCNNCAHTRCKKCPRFPDKSSKEPSSKTFAAETIPIAVDSTPVPGSGTRIKSLTVPAVPTGKELIRKTPVHRVRRTCHKCDATFIGKATECTGCKHLRCPKCPRDPPKLEKFPDGYPGDTEEAFTLAERKFKPIRTRTRSQCHECRKVFLEHQKTCGGCGHEKCETCLRNPPKKVKADFPADVVRSLEAKLAKVNVAEIS